MKIHGSTHGIVFTQIPAAVLICCFPQSAGSENFDASGLGFVENVGFLNADQAGVDLIVGKACGSNAICDRFEPGDVFPLFERFQISPQSIIIDEALTRGWAARQCAKHFHRDK